MLLEKFFMYPSQICYACYKSSRTSSIIAEKKNWNTRFFCDYLHFTSIIWHCGCDNMKKNSCILPKFVMHVTSDQFSDKFNNGWKISLWLIYCDILHFKSIIWPCWHDNMKSFSFIAPKFVMHVTNKQFSDKFNNIFVYIVVEYT